MNIHDLAVRAAALAALSKRVAAAQSAVKAALSQAMEVEDRKVARLADGTKVGTVSYAKGRTTARVVDLAAFTAWVKANRATEITEQVRPAFVTNVLDAAKASGVAVDPSTGEVIPGVDVYQSDPYLSVRTDEVEVENAWNDGRLILADVLQEIEP